MEDITFIQAEHLYKIGDKIVPHVTQILRDAGLVFYPGNSDDARELGKRVHEVIHLYDTPGEGELDEATIDPAWLPYLEQYKAFKQSTGFEVTHSEVPLLYEEYGFAGTEDKIGLLAGNLSSLVDLKTGSPAKWHVCQLAAYKELARHAGLEIKKAFNLYLTPTSYRLREASYLELIKGWEVFSAALTICKFKET